MAGDELKQLNARIDRLAAHVKRLHHRVTELQAGNISRLNAWRQATILEACSGVRLGSAFNGQISKHECFQDIRSVVHSRLAVETGTHLGHTTAFLARHFKHVVTLEVDEALLQQAKMNCAGINNITFIHGDSSRIDDLWRAAGLPVEELDFAYLDAHWHEHCPLREELDFVLTRAKNAVVFVDDFRVHDDASYGYDRYPSIALELGSIADLVGAASASMFYPTRIGVHDTSVYFEHLEPRGTLIVAPQAIADACRALRSLREVEANAY